MESTGVEIIATPNITEDSDENVTRIPLHLVNLDDLSQKSDKHDHVNSEDQEDKNSATTTVKTIQGHQQILPPIEVGLQLGHPQETVVAPATVAVEAAEVSEKAPPPTKDNLDDTPDDSHTPNHSKRLHPLPVQLGHQRPPSQDSCLGLTFDITLISHRSPFCLTLVSH